MRPTAGILHRLILAVLDGGLLLLALRGAYAIRFESGLLAVPKGTPPLGHYAPSFVFVFLLGVILFEAHGLYRRRALLGRFDECWLVIRAVSVVFLVAMAATFIYREISFSRLWLAIAWACASAALVAGRLAFRRLETWRYRRGHGVRRVAIAGTGEMARALYEKLRDRPGLGMVPVGLLGPAPEAGVKDARGVTIPQLGSIEDVSSLAGRHQLDLLIVTELGERGQVLDLVVNCQAAGLECSFVPDLFSLMTSGANVIELDGVPLITLRATSARRADRALKRVLDLIGASLALLATGPLLALLAIAVRLESRGPVIYRQRRVGHDGRTFTMYKFRSMRIDAEAETGATWAHDDDPRATRVGRVLRRLSLDELPQLVNVLRGEMSLVGPRPEREDFVRLFGGRIPRYLERLQVKSGVTGWAQVNGLRGNTSIEARTMHDIYYAENWSLAFDVKILILTGGHLLGRLRRASRGERAAELEPQRLARETDFGDALVRDLSRAGEETLRVRSARRPHVETAPARSDASPARRKDRAGERDETKATTAEKRA